MLLGAFGLLSGASVVTFHAPDASQAPWEMPNACGPVGAALAYGLVWTFGRAAALGMPLLAGAWSWNRLRDRSPVLLAVTSAMGGLLAFEICTLFGLGGLDRWTWAGGWGFAAALALHSSLGVVGSWVVGTTLLFVTALFASEMGFHWIGRLAHGLVLNPARGVAGGIAGVWSNWRERRAEAARQAAKLRVKEGKLKRGARPSPLAAVAASGSALALGAGQAQPSASSAVAVAEEDEALGDGGPSVPPPPLISNQRRPVPSKVRSLEPERPTGPAPSRRCRRSACSNCRSSPRTWSPRRT